MTTAPKADLEAALRLLAYERGTTGSAVERAAAAARVYERLAERLGPLIGVAGARALFARSLKLTGREHPCFSAELAEDATSPAEHLHACLRELGPAAASEAAAALFATFFRLLSSFIGERLVWRVLQSGFPGIEESTSKETES